MLEFLRIFGIFIAVASFVMAVFVFFRLNVPSAISYFAGNASKRLKEYQKIQKDYQKGSGNKSLPKVKNSDSTETLTNLGNDTSTGTMTDINGTATLTQADSDYASALFYAQSTTTLLDDK